MQKNLSNTCHAAPRASRNGLQTSVRDVTGGTADVKSGKEAMKFKACKCGRISKLAERTTMCLSCRRDISRSNMKNVPLVHERRPRTRTRPPRYKIHSSIRVKLLAQPCAYCGDIATEIDHIIPISLGGTNDELNLNPSCSKCNRAKGNRTLEGWLHES